MESSEAINSKIVPRSLLMKMLLLYGVLMKDYTVKVEGVKNKKLYVMKYNKVTQRSKHKASGQSYVIFLSKW